MDLQLIILRDTYKIRIILHNKKYYLIPKKSNCYTARKQNVMLDALSKFTDPLLTGKLLTGVFEFISSKKWILLYLIQEYYEKTLQLNDISRQSYIPNHNSE